MPAGAKRKYTAIVFCIVVTQLFLIAYLLNTIEAKKASLGTLASTEHTQNATAHNAFTPPEKFAYAVPGELPNYHRYEPRQSDFGVHGSDFVPEWLPEVPVVTLNDAGTNNTKDYSLEKPKNTYRIITLGDSFTFGQFLSTKDSYPEQLERLLNNRCATTTSFEVINLGVNGFDIEHSVRRFEERGKQFAPDMILWLVLQNDLREIKKVVDATLYDILLPHTTAESDGSLILHTIPFAIKAEAYREAQEVFFNEYPIESLQDYIGTLLDILDTHHDGQMLFFTIPAGGAIPDNLISIIDSFIERRSGSTHLYRSSVDLESAGGLFRDGHPNKVGNALVVEDLFAHLVEESLIPCDPVGR